MLLIIVGGLLALTSAAPACTSYYGPCINGYQLGVLRFDDLTPDTDLPPGYAGFNWTGITVAYAPHSPKGPDPTPFVGSTPGNAIAFTNPKKGHPAPEISLVSQANNNKTSGIKSFNALCVVPDTMRGSKAVNCSFALYSDTREFGLESKFDYTVPKIEPGFGTFGPQGYVAFYNYYFVVTSKVGGVKPTLIIDNMVFELQC